MNRSPYRPLLFAAVLASVALLAAAGCRQKDPITSWKSPRLLKIQKEWESLLETGIRASGKDAREKYGSKKGKLYQMLDDMISTQLSDDDVRRLADSCEEVPLRYKDRSEFTNDVLAHIVRVFVDSGNRDRLVKLLSMRCPPRISAPVTIEACLIVLCRKKLKDPTLILGDAYAKCQIPSVRHDIAAAVRRGFTDLGIRGKDDSDFVKNAMQWYKKEKDNLVPNLGYVGNEDGFPLEVFEDDPTAYERNASRREPLFKRNDAGGTTAKNNGG